MNFNFLKEKNIEINKEKSSGENNIAEKFIKELENSMEPEMYTIDRFEGDLAVCQNRKTGEIKNIEKLELPEEAKEGQILKWDGNKYEIGYNETEEARARIKSKFDRLMKK